MDNQFMRVAEELDWDVERQIAVLDDFVAGFGVSSRLDAWLAERGMSVHQRFRRGALRDAMLCFIQQLGAAGAFSHYLQRELRRAAEAARQRAAEAEADIGAAALPAEPAPPAAGGAPARRWLPWPFRRPGRPPAGGVAS